MGSRYVSSLSYKSTSCNITDVFKKDLPEARQQGIRFIAINRRNFPGSTPFTSSELSAIQVKGAGALEYVQFLLDRGKELVGFIVSAIKQLELPYKNSEGGGISLMGWSLGNTYMQAIVNCLLDVDLPEEWKILFEESLNSLIVYGAHIYPFHPFHTN